MKSDSSAEEASDAPPLTPPPIPTGTTTTPHTRDNEEPLNSNSLEEDAEEKGDKNTDHSVRLSSTGSEGRTVEHVTIEPAMRGEGRVCTGSAVLESGGEKGAGCSSGVNRSSVEDGSESTRITQSPSEREMREEERGRGGVVESARGEIGGAGNNETGGGVSVRVCDHTTESASLTMTEPEHLFTESPKKEIETTPINTSLLLSVGQSSATQTKSSASNSDQQTSQQREETSRQHKETNRQHEETSRQHKETKRQREETSRQHKETKRQHEETSRQHKETKRQHEETSRQHKETKRQCEETKVSNNQTLSGGGTPVGITAVAGNSERAMEIGEGGEREGESAEKGRVKDGNLKRELEDGVQQREERKRTDRKEKGDREGDGVRGENERGDGEEMERGSEEVKGGSGEERRGEEERGRRESKRRRHSGGSEHKKKKRGHRERPRGRRQSPHSVSPSRSPSRRRHSRSPQHR